MRALMCKPKNTLSIFSFQHFSAFALTRKASGVRTLTPTSIEVNLTTVSLLKRGPKRHKLQQSAGLGASAHHGEFNCLSRNYVLRNHVGYALLLWEPSPSLPRFLPAVRSRRLVKPN